MTPEAWATIVTSIVIPILLRFLVHYFPWLADDVKLPGGKATTKPPPAEEATE